MGNVLMKNGLGFSERSGARYIDMAAVTTVADTIANPIKPTIPENRQPAMPWACWGTNNLLPVEMAADIESCGILNSIIDMKMRFAIGSGIVPVVTRLNEKTGERVIEKYVNDAEISDFIENNNIFFQSQAWIKDQLGFAQGVGRFGLNKKKAAQRIITLQRDDVTEFRYEKKNAKGVINNIYLSAEWDKVRGIDDKRLIPVPHLSWFNPVNDLAKQAAGGGGYQFAFTFRYPGWNRHYYSMPLWYAALKWVKIAQGVPEMKAAIFENSMHVKYVVVIHETYWTKAFPDWKRYTDDQRTAKKTKVYDDIDNFLVGAKNAYKSVFTTGYRDTNNNNWTDIEIKPIEDNQKDGKLLPDSAAANSEIAFAMHFNNSLIGGNQKGGLYQQESGGSSVREAGLMQVILMELERQNVRRVLHVPKVFNEWDKKHPGLDFIIPTTVLTTLDTGAGSKPVVTGDTKTKEDGTD